MRGAYKQFDNKLYSTFDANAKEAVRLHLTAKCHVNVVVPPENYGIDLYSTFNGAKMYHEVEVNMFWKVGSFPFDSGSIPERKIRLIEMYKGSPLYFWRLRADLERSVVFSAVHMNDRYLVEVPNRNINRGEFFYRIPLHLGKEIDLIWEEQKI